MPFYDRKPQSLKELIRSYLKDFPEKKRLKKGMILSLWPVVVGEAIAHQSDNLHFEGDKLIVNVNDTMWRHELHMQRYAIMKKLNKEVQENIVKEIIVRA